MKNKLVTAICAVLIVLVSSSVVGAPFGGKDDVNYSKTLWKAMVSAGYVGKHGIMSTPYVGQAPHGAILDTVDGKLKVSGKSNHVIIKRNYGGPGVSKEAVANNPAKFLKAVTVMYKRPGYDADNKNWFWAKFKPNGDLHKNPKGMKLAGKVAKGMPKGCIACHRSAPGGDMVFNHDRLK